MAPAGGDLGVAPERQLVDRDVVDGDLDPVGLTPLPGLLAVEPGVEGGDEVGPLGDAQLPGWAPAAGGSAGRPALARAAAPPGAARTGGADGSRRGEAEKLPPAELLPVHPVLLVAGIARR